MIEIRKNIDGSLDEIIAEDCKFHFEKMDETLWWFSVTVAGVSRLSVFLRGKTEIDITEEPDVLPILTSTSNEGWTIVNMKKNDHHA